MGKRGRPTMEFNKELFESLCGIMCTEAEICGILRTSDKTLNNWCQRTYGMNFSEVYKVFTARGKASLRRNQFKIAQKSAAMAIFLGKNYLGQTDRAEVEDTTALDKLDAILKSMKETADADADAKPETE